MATKTESILALLNQIRNDQQLVLPDLQRDFVWEPKQIRLLLDSIMRGYPFGSLLFWQTRFLEVPYRNFVVDYTSGQIFVSKTKEKDKPLRMVLDGQQRLQSLYIALFGTFDRRRLCFNITSGPGTTAANEDADEGLGTSYRFEFWRDDDTNRPKRLISVEEIVTWAPRQEDMFVERVIERVGLQGEEASRARSNMRTLRSVMRQEDLVPVEIIDENATDAASARNIDEILEIFVRVNTGGTRLHKSDLMFSLLKSRWQSARSTFDDLLRDVERRAPLNIDKDFLIRGLLTVIDAPVEYNVDNVRKHWEEMSKTFGQFSFALRSSVDFCRSADVGILSRSLLDPIQTLFPVVYFLYQQKNGSVPEEDRSSLRAILYFLLFNGFVKSEARIRYLRQELAKQKAGSLPLEALLKVISARQTHTHTSTTAEMLNGHPRLTLNIAQPQVARGTLSWQERMEADHIFPQSIFRPQFGDLVDDIGNLAYLGKLALLETLWVKFEGAAVEVDGAAEAFAAAEAAGGVLDPLDFRVERLAGGVGDRPLAVVQQNTKAAFEGVGQAEDRTQLRSARPTKPGPKEVAGALHLAIAEEVHQRLLDGPGPRGLEVAFP